MRQLTLAGLLERVREIAARAKDQLRSDRRRDLVHVATVSRAQHRLLHFPNV